MAAMLTPQPIESTAHREGASTTVRVVRHGGAFRAARLRRLPLSERGLLALMLLAVVAAGWPSFNALLALADGDTPVSTVPLAPFMGALFLLRRFNPAQLQKRPHDGFIDGIILILLCVLTTVVLLLLPVAMSWDFWLDRLDIPGLVLLLTCLVVAAWGLPGLAQLGPGLAYLLLSWPLPYVLLYNRIIPPLTDLTSSAVNLVAPLLRLGIQPDPQDTHTLLYQFQGHLNSIVVAQSCAGINGALGLAVIGLPIALLGRGSWEARGTWLALGIVLSWLVNVARIVIIVAAAVLWGPDLTMALLHPVLGMIFFALSFALLLALAPLCHLDVAAPWRTPRRPSAAASGSPRRARGPRLALTLGAILLAGALFDNNLAQFRGVAEATLPRVGLARADRLFPLPRGWFAINVAPISGWEPIFGPSTVAAALTIVRPTQADSLVYVQAVLTRDAASFNTYGVEDCYAFHGYTLRSVRRVPLGHGVTATQIDFQDGRYQAAAVYWIQPVQTLRGLYHERVVLITDAATARLQGVHLSPPTDVSTSPVQQVATMLDEALSPWTDGGGGAAYQAANDRLQRLGQIEIAQELEDAGPSV